MFQILSWGAIPPSGHTTYQPQGIIDQKYPHTRDRFVTLIYSWGCQVAPSPGQSFVLHPSPIGQTLGQTSPPWELKDVAAHQPTHSPRIISGTAVNSGAVSPTLTGTHKDHWGGDDKLPGSDYAQCPYTPICGTAVETNVYTFLRHPRSSHQINEELWQPLNVHNYALNNINVPVSCLDTHQAGGPMMQMKQITW